ncbi:thioredoxin-like protein [Cercophora newfieldiana]|uniref:thioredoxin-dependent peroxiredoxin n=1 Tax=Cercophora newfieldiana TaxID=92897 RepID=A0AA40CW93_9PEZI|nr:thioredoxin-like protein [Cercophora newfieldiana]
MPVELRKRKAPAPPPEPPAAKKQSKVSKAATKVKEVKDAVVKPRGRPAKTDAPTTNGKAAAAKKASPEPAKPAGKPEVGNTIELDGFGGEIQKNDGTTTTLKALVDESKAGVVLFTYPKASTPGCTKQVCLFRDSYTPLTASGLAIYGLSADSPKANTTFKEKQKLPYPLLCDPSATLIGAIGLKKAPKGTTRGVFVVDKTGKILAAQPGSPDGTVAVVKKIVESLGAAEEAEEVPVESEEPVKGSEEKEEKAEEAKESEKVDEKVAEEKENGEKAEEEKPAEEVAEKKDVEMADVPNGEAKAVEEKEEGEKKDE